jgi:predicted dithiol-disulfide oxidoreductase (DUF899 family)
MDGHTTLKDRIRSLEERMMDERQELARLRASLPAEEVSDFELGSIDGPVSLRAAFCGHRDLLVIHNMGIGCTYCTLWADGFNGILAHLENRASFVVVSQDPPEVQAEFAKTRGWKFRMLSDPTGRFTRAMGFAREEDGEEQPWPGVSAFSISSTGKLLRTGSDSFGPGDTYCAAWHLFGLLPQVSPQWEPQYEYTASLATPCCRRATG